MYRKSEMDEAFGATGALKSLADVDGMKSLPGIKNTFSYDVQEREAYSKYPDRYVMTFTTEVFKSVQIEGDDYVPRRVDRRAVIFRNEKKFFNVFGSNVYRCKKFNVVVGRHIQREMPANRVYVNDALLTEILEFAGSPNVPIQLEPYKPNIVELLRLRHPRRDINTGVIFAYISIPIGLLTSLIFFCLDIARDVFSWDALLGQALR